MLKSAHVTSAALLSFCLLANHAIAQSGNWSTDGNYVSGNINNSQNNSPLVFSPQLDWSDTNNWVLGTVANGADNTALFDFDLTNDLIVTLDSSRTIGGITYAETDAQMRIDPAASEVLTLAVTSGTPTINVENSGRDLYLGVPIAGNDGLAKTGSGDLEFQGASTFTGGIDLSAGRIVLRNNAGGVNNEAQYLGNASNVLTFSGDADLHMDNGTVTLPQGAQINTGVNARFTGAFGERLQLDGPLTGDGNLTVQGFSAGFDAELRSTNNTFTGPIEVRSGDSITLGVRSLADSANNISLQSNGNQGAKFEWLSGSDSAVVFNNRVFELIVDGNGDTNLSRQPGILNNDNEVTETVTINTDLLITGSGSKNFIFGGGNQGDNAFNGLIPDATDDSEVRTLSLFKQNGGKWILGNNSNEYAGSTSVLGGTLSFGSIADYGNVSALGAPAAGDMQVGQSSSNATLQYTGAGHSTNRTIQIGSGDTQTNRTGGAIINNDGGGALVFTAAAINTPVAGVQADRRLQLGGTYMGAGNEIQGIIQDNDTGATGLVNVITTDSAIWQLSAANTYSGTTSVQNSSTLIGTNPQAFGTNLSGITIQGGGTLSLRNDSSVTFGVGATGYDINSSAGGSTINVDRASGTGNNTISVGNLTTTSTAGTWELNFTGSTGVSLNAGTLTTPESTSATTHTIDNDIDSTTGATLNLASVVVPSTNIEPVLAFAGSGNTIVTGAITQTTAALGLRKNGEGTLTLNGVNTYQGDTTVNDGILSITNAYLADAASVSLNGDAIFDLNFLGDDTIAELFLDGLPQGNGTYNASTNPTWFTGTGSLVVSGGGGTLAGDYNDDGTVDLADYTIWRNNLGNTGTMPNDVDGGVIGEPQYNTWRGNFGATGPVSSVVATVPEPSAMVLLAGIAGLGFWRLRKRNA